MLEQTTPAASENDGTTTSPAATHIVNALERSLLSWRRCRILNPQFSTRHYLRSQGRLKMHRAQGEIQGFDLRVKFSALAFAALVVTGLAPSVNADPSLTRILAGHTLKVGVAINVPWVIKKPDGTLEGYDIDLAKALATDMGVTANFVEMPFQDLVAKLSDGTIDVVAAGLAITPARALSVVFSDSTGAAPIRTVAAIASLGSDPVKTLETRGYKIGVMAQSTDEAAARAAYPAATITTYPSQGAALAALIAGSEQAMVASAPVPTMATKLYDADLRLVGLPLTHTAEAFALRPDDARLLSFVNNWIVARTADGYLENTRNYWFYSFSWLHDLEPRDDASAK